MSNSLRLDDHADHPRRFLSWQEEYLLAYGGDDGTLTILVGKDGSSTNSRWIQARQWDDAIRAIAISPNGKRVAAGFETGAITIYVYDDYKVTNGSTKEPHPFFKKAWQKWQRRQEQQKEDDGDDDDDDHGLLSQSSLGMGDNGEDEELSFPGPPMSAPIRDLQFDPRCGGGNDSSSSSSSHPYFLAIATEAGFAISNVTSSQTLLPLLLQEAGEQGHDASGVRGLCYMQNSPPSLSSSSTSTTMLLATLAMDGRMCFWNVTHCGDPELDWELFHRDASKCIAKPDVGELNGADAADRSCRPFCIMPTRRSGNVSFLALPGQTDVMLRPMQHVQQQKFLPSLDGKGHIEPIVAMTGQGQYLVTSGRDGRVNLWKLPGSNQEDELSSGRFLAQMGHYESVPTDMAWMQPRGKQSVNDGGDLYVACADGTFAIISSLGRFIPNNEQADKVAVDEEEATSKGAKKTNATNSTNKTSKGDSKSGPVLKKRSVYVDDEAEADDDMAESRIGRHEDDDDDATVDMVQALKSSAAVVTFDSPRRSISSDPHDAVMQDGYDDEDDDDLFNNDHRPGLQSMALRLPEPQHAFAPSATPLDLTRRILCWNHIGVISLLRGDDALVRNMVNIEFTDVTLRRPMSFTDNMNFILGSLGDEGAIFATDLQDENADEEDDMNAELTEGLNISERTKAMVKKSQRQRMAKDQGADKSTGSSIYFHRFETFGSLRDKDWYWSLPDGERVHGCACGEGWAAVATSRRFLRFFTLGGNQGQIIWLKGDLVTMVGRSRFLAVFFHEANPLMDGTQKLGYVLFDAIACRILSKGSVSSVSKRSALSWAGFSNDFSLMVMDTDGMLSMLISTTDVNSLTETITPSSWEWTPILDTVGLRKSTEDSIWPIAVQDGKLVCVPLKGGNQYPDATRRPVTATLSLRTPLARGGAVAKIVALEELSVRANMALNQKRVITNFSISTSEEKHEFEEEYESMCAQVDKVTLQLYRAMVEAGKLERALDLVHRLHLEKSFDIAITMADRLNHRNLSDRIENVKDRWLSLIDADQPADEEDDLVAERADDDEEEEEDDEDFGNNQYDSIDLERDVGAGKSNSLNLTENAAGPIRRISPDSHRAFKRPFDQVGEERMSKNPFTKKRLESPAHKSNLITSTSPKRKISRASTFSTKSREKNRASKNFL